MENTCTILNGETDVKGIINDLDVLQDEVDEEMID